MYSNQQVTNGAALTPAMIDALLKDPNSWLSKQQQAALDERFRLRKELIKQEYRLAHEKEMDEHMAEVEAEKFLQRQTERARVQGLDEYYAEQHQLALKLEGAHLAVPDYFSALLTRQADLVQAVSLLRDRDLQLTTQIELNQSKLNEVQAELKVVTQDWEKAKTQVQQTKDQIGDELNGTIILDKGLSTEREVSLSVDVLPEYKRAKLVEYRRDAMDRLIEAFMDDSIRYSDGSINLMKYQIIMAPVFMDVLAEQGVQRSIGYSHFCAIAFLPRIENLANMMMYLEMLSKRRQELGIEQAELTEMLRQMKREKELLREDMLQMQEQISQVSKKIANQIAQQVATESQQNMKKSTVKVDTISTPYGDAELIVKFRSYMPSSEVAKLERTKTKLALDENEVAIDASSQPSRGRRGPATAA